VNECKPLVDGTPAAEYPDQVEQAVRDLRRDQLIQMQQAGPPPGLAFPDSDGFDGGLGSGGFRWIPSSPAGDVFAVFYNLYGHFDPIENNGFWNRTGSVEGRIRADSWTPELESASPGRHAFSLRLEYYVVVSSFSFVLPPGLPVGSGAVSSRRTRLLPDLFVVLCGALMTTSWMETSVAELFFDVKACGFSEHNTTTSHTPGLTLSTSPLEVLSRALNAPIP